MSNIVRNLLRLTSPTLPPSTGIVSAVETNSLIIATSEGAITRSIVGSQTAFKQGDRVTFDAVKVVGRLKPARQVIEV